MKRENFTIRQPAGVDEACHQSSASHKLLSGSPSSHSAVPMSKLLASSTHLVLIPSYNPGAKVDTTVRNARAQWNPVWVVVDGSTDGSAERLQAMARTIPGCA